MRRMFLRDCGARLCVITTPQEDPMNLRLEALQRPANRSDLVTLGVRVAGVAVVLSALAFAAPLVWSAVSAGVGLLALAGIGMVGMAAFHVLPYLMQRLENRLLRLRKEEARRNPMEQLDNDCLRREQRLLLFRKALVTIGAQIEAMREMLDDRRQIDPAQVLDRQERALKRMAEFHALNVRRLGEAQAALDDFRRAVAQKRFEWEFALGAEVIWESLNPSKADELLQDLLTDEALRAVQSRFNAVFAELDIEMRSVEGPGRRLLDESQLDRLDALRLPSAIPTRRPT
jgi:hypothetical protein